MTNRITTLAVAALLVLAACGSAEVAPATTALAIPTGAETATTSGATTSSVAVPQTPDNSDTGAALKAGTLGATLLHATEPEVAQSGRFEATTTMEPGADSEFEGEVSITLSGAFNDETGDSEILMDWGDLVAAGMAADEGADALPPEAVEIFSEPMQIKTIGDKTYMKWSFFAMFLGTDKWIEGDASDTDQMTSGFGFGADGESPTALLENLAGANAQVEDLGQEDVRGVTTTHYRAVLDIQALADQMDADQAADLADDVGDLSMVDFPIDLWIGEDGNVYRYSIEVDATAAGTESEDFERMTMVFEMWDYGADIVIEPPPADEIASEDELSFGFGSDG